MVDTTTDDIHDTKDGCIEYDVLVSLHGGDGEGFLTLFREEAAKSASIDSEAWLKALQKLKTQFGGVVMAAFLRHLAQTWAIRSAREGKDTDDTRAFTDRVVIATQGDPWEDTEFPADLTSIFFNTDEADPEELGYDPAEIEWLRPDQFHRCENPQLFSDAPDANQPIQGALSNCWFLSSVSVLGTYPHLLEKLFDMANEDVYGAVTVRLYKRGCWHYVTVDTRIPCLNGKPLFARNRRSQEYWMCVLEKAYAKIHGCYEALVDGEVDYGLRDVTGSIPSIPCVHI